MTTPPSLVRASSKRRAGSRTRRLEMKQASGSLRAACHLPILPPTSGPCSPTWPTRRPTRPPSCTAKGRSGFAELLELLGARGARARRSRRRAGRSRGAVAAQHAGLSDPLFRLRAARRHRRRGQHALSRRRGRRHRRPLGRQGAGLRAGLPPHRLPVDPGRRRARRARPALRHRHRRRDARAGAAGHRASAGACRSTACCRARASPPTTPRPARRATSSRPRARPARPSSCCIARARSPATPSRSRAPSASTRPRRCRSAILPLCGVFGFNQTLATLAAGKPCVLVESYEIEEIARLITAAPADDDVRQRRHVSRACSSWCRASWPFPLDQVGGLCRASTPRWRTSAETPSRAA